VTETRRIAIHGLGFGDCGKGLFTDALCRRRQAHTVVRFNGGAQAGHNVVLADGRHHTFSQFGSGSFLPGVASVLAYPVVIHPGALWVEAEELARQGVGDALARLLIDRRCRVISPFHQAAGRLRELRRGANAHGSCGVGVGETVRHALEHPDEVLRYGDLASRGLAREKLAAIRRRLRAEFVATADDGPAAATELRLIDDDDVADRWLDRIQALLARVAPATPAAIAERLHRPGTVIFEGAQGVLLDEWRGFHPHTSWSRIHRSAAEEVLADAGIAEPMQHLGVLRSYLTRHGAGPLPTETRELDGIAEAHNGDDGWQGPIRRGHPDALLLRYALAAVGGVDGLLLSHLDAFSTVGGLRWCEAYRVSPHRADDADTDHSEVMTALALGRQGDLQHQAGLTRLLASARPVYARERLQSASALVERIRTIAACPVVFGSCGPTHEAVQALG
jgi:adenylosuccinate synthase